MDQRTKHDACRRDGWVARLMQTQLAVTSFGARVEPPTGADRFPARLIHSGAVLMGVSSAVLITWLRHRL